MADLKISAATLNPAPAGTDNLATDKAGADFRTTLDQIKTFAAAGAGDVFKVGTPANNQLGIWTGDGTIEGSSNLQFTGSQLLLLNGSLGAPSYSFVVDGNTGFYRPVDDAIGIVAGGVEMARFVEAVGIEQSLILNNDNTGLPDLGSLGDPDTGFNWDVANGLYTVQGGIRQWNWSSTSYFGQNSGGPLLSNVLSSSTVPTIIPTRSDINTGIGATDTGEVHLIGNSVTGLTIRELNGGVIQVPASAIAVTAFATGGQASAVTLWNSYNVISVCASPGDSVKLPSAFGVGSIHFIKNNGAASCDVFPANGDNLGAGIDTAVAVPAGQSISFIGTVASTTWTQLIVSAAGGGGDVTKVGTPVNNQVGVWTGDGTLEGDTGLTWSGTILSVTGTIQATTASGPALLNESPTFNNPTVLPNRADPDTGLGYGGTDVLVLVAGATQIVRIVEGVGNNQTIFGQDNAPALPTVAFGDGDTGFFESLDDQLGLSLGGAQKWFWSGDIFGSLLGGGAAILNETASATNPTIIPDRGDIDTGLGQNAAGQPSLIGNGVELARGVAAGSGGLQANNTATGAGLERVLTTSDLTTTFPEFQFFADQLENPITADWAVNALAPAAADSNNSGLTVRLFDDTAEEGVGFIVEVPAGATNIVFDFVARAETAPGAVNTVGLDIYNRGIPNNAAVQAWSASTALTDISIPTNEFFQEDTQSVTLATLGVTAGETTQFELVRTLPGAGTDLTGDWDLLLVKVSFT